MKCFFMDDKVLPIRWGSGLLLFKWKGRSRPLTCLFFVIPV